MHSAGGLDCFGGSLSVRRNLRRGGCGKNLTAAGCDIRVGVLVAGVAVLSGVALDASTHAIFAQEAIQLDTIEVRGRSRSSAGRQAAPAEQVQSTQVEVIERGDGPVQGIVATRSVTGTKTDTPITEIPQSISVVTQDQITEQGAQTISESLRYTPGVFAGINGESAKYDETRIRGFLPYYYLDGMPLPLNRFFATPRIEPYGLERIEVLKGPSSVLYGQNSPGGLINMISKRPTLTPFGEIEVSAGSHDWWQGAFDVGGPGNADKSFLYRFTGLVRDSDTMVNFAKDKRLFLAPSFTFRNFDSSLTLLMQYGKDQGSYPQQYLPAQGTLFPNPNGRIPRSFFVGEPNWDRFEREQWAVGYAFEHRFNETWQFRQNLRYMAVDTYWQAHRSEGFIPPDLVNLQRGAYSQDTDARTFTIDNQLQADFATGPLQHKVLFGLDYFQTAGNNDFRYAFPPMWGGTVQPINVFNPVYNGSVPPLVPRYNYHDRKNQLGIYAQDQIKFDRWILTVGGRHDWSDVSVTDSVANTYDQVRSQAWTGRAGLGYTFDNGVTPYIAAATSFEQETTVGFPSGKLFEPTTGVQYEAGIKYQPVGTKALFTAAVYDLTRKNVITTNPAFIAIQTGEVNVRGVELDAKVSVTDRLDVIAAYTYMDSEITESSNPLQLGRPQPMTPHNMASGWIDYMVLPGLKLGGGVRYVGANYSETETVDQLLVPSYVVYDAAVRYDFGALDRSLKGLELRVNATNLFDKNYVTYCYGYAYCSLAPGRTVLATMAYRW
ncbi:iron complex outermembrane receptor protein [Pseudorhodoplanes sinuspersici]|nr:iron complex outermembrane receptor protein [Pseudorhodoplanes sinuspersici]